MEIKKTLISSKNDIIDKAYARARDGKAGRAELEILKMWAKNEIQEWEGFLVLVEVKINTLPTL